MSIQYVGGAVKEGGKGKRQRETRKNKRIQQKDGRNDPRTGKSRMLGC